MSKQLLEKGIVPELQELIGSNPPDSGFYGSDKSINEMLDVVKDKFSEVSGHNHDGSTNAGPKIKHSDLLLDDTTHDTKQHGYTGAHDEATTIARLNQIAGLESSNPAQMNTSNLVKLVDGSEATGLHAHPHGLSSHTDAGDKLAEARVAFDAVAGHDHGTIGKQIKHSDLSLDDTAHDTKQHGYTGAHDEAATVARLDQISGLESAPVTVSSNNVINLLSRQDLEVVGSKTLHYHKHKLNDPMHHDLDDAAGHLPEALVDFDSAAGHEHDGVSSKKIAVSNLAGVGADVTAGNLTALTNGNTVPRGLLHKHSPEDLVKESREFGMAPEFANMVFDKTGIVDSNGQFLGGFVRGVPGGMQSYLEWTSAMASYNSYRLHVMIKLPSDFGGWDSATPLKFWHQTVGATSDVSMLVEISSPNGMLTTFTPAVVTLDNNWTEHTVTQIDGTFLKNDWFTISFTFGAQNGAKIRLGRMNFKYDTYGV